MTDNSSVPSDDELKTVVDEYHELCRLFLEKIKVHETSKNELLLFVDQCRDIGNVLRHGGLRKEGERLLQMRGDMKTYLESGTIPTKSYNEFLPESDSAAPIDIEPIKEDVSTIANPADIAVHDGMWKERDGNGPRISLESIDEMRNEGNFDEAGNTLGRLVEKNAADSVKFRLKLGNIYRANGKLKWALAQYDEAIESGILSKQEQSEARRQMGTIYRNLGFYDRAGNAFEDALKLLSDDHHLDKAAVYNDYAILSWRLGNLKRMEDHLKESMTALGRNDGLKEHLRTLDGSPTFLDPVDNQTSMDATFEAIENTVRTNEGLSEAVRNLGKSGVVPNAYNNHGLLELERFEYGEAAAAFKKSYIIRRLMHRGEPPVIAYTWMNFGKLFDVQAMYEQALRCYERAHAIFASNGKLGPDHLLCGEMKNMQGNILLKLCRMEESSHCYKDALRIAKLQWAELKEKSGSGSLAGAVTCNNIGILCIQVKQLEKAKLNFEMALQIYSEHLEGGDHKDWDIKEAAAGQSAGIPPALSAFDQKNSPDWLANIEHTSSMVYETSFGRDIPSLAILYNNMGNMKICMGNPNEAYLYYNKSLDIKTMTLPEQHPSKFVTMHNIKVAKQEQSSESSIVV
eukprot:scaffold10069_cov69-Cylindrotheca_fusiformis.AAC.17